MPVAFIQNTDFQCGAMWCNNVVSMFSKFWNEMCERFHDTMLIKHSCLQLPSYVHVNTKTCFITFILLCEKNGRSSCMHCCMRWKTNACRSPRHILAVYISYLISGISEGGHNRKNNLWNILPRIDCYVHWQLACRHCHVPIGNCLASFMPSRNPNDHWQHWQWTGRHTYYH